MEYTLSFGSETEILHNKLFYVTFPVFRFQHMCKPMFEQSVWCIVTTLQYE